jgi:PAS domain S-box-containing protein
VAQERAKLPHRTALLQNPILWFSAAALIILFAATLVASWAVTQQFASVRESHVLAQRNQRVLASLQAIFSTLQDAETGERGFVITGDAAYRQPYEHAAQSLDAQLLELNRLYAREGLPPAAIELSRLSQRQLQYLGRLIELREKESASASAAPARQQLGKQQMDRIRELIAELRASEEHELQHRSAQYEHTSLRAAMAVRIALAIAITLVIVSGLLMVRHTRQRFVAERTARDAYDLLRGIVDNVTQGVAVFDSQRRLVAWNEQFARLRGLPQEALVPMRSIDEIAERAPPLLIDEGDGRELRPMRSKIGRPFSAEAQREDGLVLQIRAEHMTTGHFIVTYQDVTQLRVSERQAREQATRLSAILDNAADAIITINESGSIESWSKSAERLFGYTAQEVLRRNVSMLMDEPHRGAHDGYLRRYLQTGERRIIGGRRELEALAKDGRHVPVELGINEMWLGTRRLFVGIVRDISGRREVERLKASFVSTVSHELRTPLTSIAGSLGLLAGGVAGALPSKAVRLVDIAKLNCDRLVRLINDILDLEKAESGRLEFHFEMQSMLPIVSHAVEINRAYAQGFGVTIELASTEDDVQTLVDRDRLLQVLTNLISNAAKFSPRGGVVTVSLRVEGDVVRVCVIDRGPGIDEAFQRRIFQKFAQADSSDSRAKGGTGLGLSIAKTIVERMGGHIGFDTQSGKGTNFYFTLPLQRRSIVDEPKRAADEAGLQLLVCEDDPDIALILTEILRSAGMRAINAVSAQAARALLEQQRFDAAIIDLHLPDGDGLELIADLREQERTRSMPVVIVTARSRDPQHNEQLAVLQVGDWLQKPVDPQRLLDAIRNGISAQKGRVPRILHVEDDSSLTLLIRELLSNDAEVHAVHTVAQAKLWISEPFDLVILDINLADGSGLDLLPLLRDKHRPAPPVILYSATEPSRELTARVEAALVKSRHSIGELLQTVRALASRHNS